VNHYRIELFMPPPLRQSAALLVVGVLGGGVFGGGMLGGSVSRSGPGLGALAATRVVARRGVVESAPISLGRIDLAARSCARSACKLVVEFVPKRGRRSSVVLPWGVPGTKFRQEPAGGRWGAVDLLAPPDADVAWASGDENDYVSTSMRTATLPGGDTGVVVDQLAGFEHLVHAHVLLAVVDGSLREVKRWTGNGSPTVSALATTDTEVIFEELFFDPAPSNADQATFTAYRWDGARARLAEQPRTSPLSALVVQQYTSFGAGRAAFGSAKETNADGFSCLVGTAVLDSAILPGLTTGPAFIGALTTNSAWADAAAATLRACAPRWSPRVVAKIR
jgi:hypothetical protein